MKTLRLLALFCIILLCVLVVSLQALKTKTVASFSKDEQLISSYQKWGLTTDVYQKQLDSILSKTKEYSLVALPLNLKTIETQRKYILASALGAYVNEVNTSKQNVDGKLTYLRDRVKISGDLTTDQKGAHFLTLDGIAGEVFEKEPTLAEIQKAISQLEKEDTAINNEIEVHQKDNVFAEIETYKGTCEDLRSFFEEKNKQDYVDSTDTCIVEAEKLLSPQYRENSVQFIEAIAREKVFSLVQTAQDQKAKVLADEQYALQKAKKDEEYLTIVPETSEKTGKAIVVNLTLQRLYAYENGQSVFPNSILITSGKQGFETITGSFAIYLKERYHKMQSPFPGIYYDDVVSYWMPFFSGYGLHDATWRSVYGTQDYLAVGSHGCVNMSLADAEKLYNWAEVGTKVIIQ